MDKKLEDKIKRFHENRDKSRDHWKKDPLTGREFNYPIYFYIGNRYLGMGFIPEGSMSCHRREAARKAGINYYNGIKIGNRDLRNTRIKCKNGKIRKDVDFIHPSDFPESESIFPKAMHGGSLTKRQFRKHLYKHKLDEKNIQALRNR